MQNRLGHKMIPTRKTGVLIAKRKKVYRKTGKKRKKSVREVSGNTLIHVTKYQK